MSETDAHRASGTKRGSVPGLWHKTRHTAVARFAAGVLRDATLETSPRPHRGRTEYTFTAAGRCCRLSMHLVQNLGHRQARGMARPITTILVLVVTFVCCARTTASPPVDGIQGNPPLTTGSEPFLLGPPKAARPVVVRARFEVHNINEIDDEHETFELTGALILKWHDPRQAFDPAVAGVDEKIFQGTYQFNEISPGWFPQLVLVNRFGSYESDGIVLRISPDGTSTLVETMDAAVKTRLSMRRYPFDRHRLEAVFELLGFDQDEVVLQMESEAASSSGRQIWVPQWTVRGVSLSVRDRAASYAGRRGVSSALVVGVDVQREPFFVLRLVVFPLAVIVLLSFSVFWMDQSSLGDRMSVSFIGILTAVAYQTLMSQTQPPISYFTLMHGFLNLGFFTMCATVVINLVVGALDKRGKIELGNRIDSRCRWIFPFTYFGLMLVMLGVAFLFF